jgi:hypothetical protein
LCNGSERARACACAATAVARRRPSTRVVPASRSPRPALALRGLRQQCGLTRLTTTTHRGTALVERLRRAQRWRAPNATEGEVREAGKRGAQTAWARPPDGSICEPDWGSPAPATARLRRTDQRRHLCSDAGPDLARAGIKLSCPGKLPRNIERTVRGEQKLQVGRPRRAVTGEGEVGEAG